MSEDKTVSLLFLLPPLFTLLLLVTIFPARAGRGDGSARVTTDLAVFSNRPLLDEHRWGSSGLKKAPHWVS